MSVLRDAVDYHGRRLGAPCELVALTDGGSASMLEGLEPSWLDLPADRLCLVGRRGGMVVHRFEAGVEIVAALASGACSRWIGGPGHLEPVAFIDRSFDDLARLWHLLDPHRGLGVSSAAEACGEISGRLLLAAYLDGPLTGRAPALVEPGVALYSAGALTLLARTVGAPPPTSTPNLDYLRMLMAWAGVEIPASLEGDADEVCTLHRVVPRRWEIAADIRELLGDPTSAAQVLHASPRWTG